MKFILILIKIKRKLVSKTLSVYSYFLLKIYGVDIGLNVKLTCLPVVLMHKHAKILINDNVTMHSSVLQNPVCSGHRMVLASLSENSVISIGKNTGISCSTICAMENITIGEHVTIGAGCQIYDTDFHPIDPSERLGTNINVNKTKISPVIIESNVWLGAEVMVLKGVTIGEGSMIAARSVVTKNIPPFSMAGGVPAKVIRKINDYS